MAVAIRLCKIGKGAKKRFQFRVVAIHNEKARDGVILEELGYYDPAKNPAVFKINKERLDHWVKMGAQLSNTISTLIKKEAKNITKV